MPEERLEDEMVDEEDREWEEDWDEPRPEFGEGQRTTDHVIVDVGRGGATASIPVGSDFVPTMERLAEEHNYGGYYRVWLNGSEVVDPDDAPAQVEAGMRIVLTPYDKVGDA